ncbi:arsenic transporter [Pseudomonas plecoglossicida]|jgi:arsenical pump membrane protein|uniref:Arsenic transporter n=2 Tax=Pseudomonas putida group TaxID=136845 RepID=A0ABX4U1N6_PSEDL|nr:MULTISPECIES: arsenic transporter [Pseudomonas]TXI00093.1 MAG: arsenic transporter [Pseudomonas monteilii]CAB5647532.1 Arsenic efflux pump protein [Pseudomonas putida]AGA71656.1 arsenical pump membrane protein [Pseudomonas putida HB3267]KYC17715.1 arsenic transporter [Pseudomonas sp. ABFPK]MBO2923521.1 arsenic transporter [Pseudomonas asiatica]
MPVFDPSSLIWAVAAVATGGVILRPWRVPEYVWAVGAAVLLTAFGLVPLPTALGAVAEGGDVYLFLIGMMVLAELARQEGLFDWLAMYAVQHARGSGQRLFDLVFLVGVLVTVFLSNDATAVVLTPAVYAACRAAKAEPLPYLFICAFIANAASFVLPISNPANLVVFGSQMPPLLDWLRQFTLPSLAAIGLTYLVLRLAQRKQIRQPLATTIDMQPLSSGARLCALGIVLTGALLLLTSALDRQLGLPTFCAGIATAGLIHLRQRRNPMPVLKGVAWGVLPLVAGLFVLVEAVAQTGVIEHLAHGLAALARSSEHQASWGAGVVAAIAGNLMNNLPTGLIAGSVGHIVDLPAKTTAALLIGVDLGPNLSITGSLATLLWLVAVRREGEHVGALDFLRLGALVMPPALIGALGLLHL